MHPYGSMLYIRSSIICIRIQYSLMLCIRHQYGSMLCIRHRYAIWLNARRKEKKRKGDENRVLPSSRIANLALISGDIGILVCQGSPRKRQVGASLFSCHPHIGTHYRSSLIIRSICLLHKTGLYYGGRNWVTRSSSIVSTKLWPWTLHVFVHCTVESAATCSRTLGELARCLKA